MKTAKHADVLGEIAKKNNSMLFFAGLQGQCSHFAIFVVHGR